MFVRLDSSCRYAAPSGAVLSGNENEVVEVTKETYRELLAAGRVRKVEIAYVIDEPIAAPKPKKRKRTK